ncbi:motility associated factor glycosyltransferase family protein [Aestuariispira insulae]|uniref:Uncharacterized protein DUF115 n=1 Tax=Aestuariispira insulae TaxID=1461337 RepID=A0A3D9HXX5_9PROT|nr:6-hydroxymethylpterin diphosphokinase MptE-like protein [Aestuariispira insulae]RED54354.1 uncharacterized protein DUF115 [Aestuariispira insulae]
MNKDLLQSNLKLLEASLPPGLAAQLAELSPGFSITGSVETGDLNLMAGGRPLFEPNAIQHSREQITRYLENPNRFYARLGGLDPKATGVADRMMQEILKSHQGLELSTLPEAGGGYLFMFGLGIGLALSPLVEQLDFRDLIVIEESPEFLKLALSLVDWSPIVDRITARGGQIHFILNDSPDAAINLLVHVIRGPHHSLLDGSYVFQTYGSPFLNGAVAKLAEVRPLLFGPKGFVEDEMTMMRNSLANLSQGPYGFLEDKTDRSIKNVPAFIIGSGPSIDGQFDLIRQWRDRVVIFSGGTGLNGLLDNGIRPDFHCEMENTTNIFDGLTQTAARHDLSGIRLIASTSVDPRVPDMFDDVIYFFRDTISSTRAFAGQHQPMAYAVPSVTNLASRSAIALGYPQHCLFGIDLGSKKPDQHHSAHSIYTLSEKPSWNRGNDMDPLAIPVKGARGGTVYSIASFMLSRSYFEQLFLSFPQCQFINCSDGADIAGTTAMDPTDMTIPASQRPVAEIVAQTRAEIPDIGPEYFQITERFQEYRNAAHQWLDQAEQALSKTPPDRFAPLYEALWPLINEATTQQVNSPDKAARWTFLGGIGRVLQLGHFLSRRIDPKDRSDFCRTLHRSIVEHLPDMRRQLNDLEQSQGQG